MSNRQKGRDTLGRGPRGGKQERLGDLVEEKVLDMHKDNFSERAIANTVGISRGGVRAVLARSGRVNYFKKANVEQVMALTNAGLTAEEVAKKVGMSTRSIYTVTHYAREAEKLQPAPNLLDQVVKERLSVGRRWKSGRYMVICDLHILFHNAEALEQCLSVKGDFDGCIIAGDFVDEYWISFFRKEGYLPHRKEVMAATIVMELLRKRFSRVLYCMGNHEDRRWKRLLEAAAPVADLAEDDAKAIYEAIEKTRNWYYNGMEGIEVHNNWWVSICNERVVVAHPDRFMSVPGNAAKAVVEHFFNHRQPYRLANLDAMLMGHTHRLDNLKHRLGIWTCELPCMCGVLPYQSSSKAGNGGTVDTGYFVLATHKDGTLWFNESRAYLLEHESNQE